MMTEQEFTEYVNSVSEQVDIAKAALQKIINLSEGKDGNVMFLAEHELRILDSIVNCAKIPR